MKTPTMKASPSTDLPKAKKRTKIVRGAKKPIEVTSDPTTLAEHKDDIRACLVTTLAQQIAARLLAQNFNLEAEDGTQKI